MTPFLKCDETLADALRARLPETMKEAVRRCTLRVLIPLVHRHDANFHGLAYVTAGNIGYAVLFARFVLFPIVLLTLLVRVYFSGLEGASGKTRREDMRVIFWYDNRFVMACNGDFVAVVGFLVALFRIG